MRAYDIIAGKRDGRELEPTEIEFLVDGYVKGGIPDYQMSAFLMAVCIRGMSISETTALTRAMVASGETLDLSSIPGIKVDKHSTGGVGDKTTLVLVPLLAAAGLKVAKLAGRGLGHTGGTLDKLESIPGMSVSLDAERFLRQVREIGAAISGQTGQLVPADKKIYALRDATATVESIPLVASSVMSKKIAAGADVILLDVKAGSGAFAKTPEDARLLAQTMIEIGKGFGKRVLAAVTDMDQPLGNAIGNALEVAEAVETLTGGGPADLRELCIELAAMALRVALEMPLNEARDRPAGLLDSGAAAEMLRQIIAAQGGDDRVVDDPTLLPKAEKRLDVVGAGDGYVTAIDAAELGRASVMLGAGREKVDDVIDPGAGITVYKKIGDCLTPADVIATLHFSGDADAGPVAERVREAYRVGPERVASRPIVLETIS